jgi:hypothetical protein
MHLRPRRTPKHTGIMLDAEGSISSGTVSFTSHRATQTYQFTFEGVVRGPRGPRLGVGQWIWEGRTIWFRPERNTYVLFTGVAKAATSR